jgi:hypothetical protein
MNGTTVRTTSPGLYRRGREYPRADVSGHATSRCTCGTGVRLVLLLFDTRLMVVIDFQEVLMRAPKLGRCCGSDKYNEVGTVGSTGNI